MFGLKINSWTREDMGLGGRAGGGVGDKNYLVSRSIGDVPVLATPSQSFRLLMYDTMMCLPTVMEF